MDHFRIAHEFDGHRPPRFGDVVVPHGVGIALNRNDEEPVNVAYVCQHAGDLLRFSNIECDATHIWTDLSSHSRGSARIAAGNHDIAAQRGVSLCQRAANPSSTTDYEDSCVQCFLHRLTLFSAGISAEFLFFNCAAKYSQSRLNR